MSDDGWGKPWTPEELAKSPTGRQASSEPNMQNIPGTPAHALEWAIERGMKLAPAANVMLQTANSQDLMRDAEAKLKADGFTQTGPDEWQKLHSIGRFSARDPNEAKAPTSGPPWMAVDEGHIGPAPNGPRYSQMMGRATRDVPPGPAVVKDWSLVTRQRDANGLYPHQAAMVEAINAMTDNDISARRGGLWSNDDPPRVEYVEGPDAWPVNPADAGEPEPLTPEHYDHPECTVSPVETIDEGDGPFYAVYFGKINYCVLAGPYATQDEAQAAIPATWERFVADSTFDFIFPTRDPAGMEARTVRSVYNLKGAYGKV